MFTIIYIFKIICKDPGDVGSTNDMKNNEGTFRSSCNFLTDKHYARYVFRFRTEHNGWDTWSCVMVKLAMLAILITGNSMNVLVKIDVNIKARHLRYCRKLVRYHSL